MLVKLLSARQPWEGVHLSNSQYPIPGPQIGVVAQTLDEYIFPGALPVPLHSSFCLALSHPILPFLSSIHLLGLTATSPASLLGELRNRITSPDL